MDELRKYLNEALSLEIEYGEWLPDADLPLFLSRSASCARCAVGDIAFVAAKVGNEEGLPGIKKVHNQLGRYTDLSVAIVSETLDARQRKAPLHRECRSSFLACRPSSPSWPLRRHRGNPGGTAGRTASPPGRKRPSSPSSPILRSKARKAKEGR